MIIECFTKSQGPSWKKEQKVLKSESLNQATSHSSNEWKMDHQHPCLDEDLVTAMTSKGSPVFLTDATPCRLIDHAL